jgi:hypothetical protein
LSFGLVKVGATLGVRDVEHHYPAMTAPLRRFAEPSPHYYCLLRERGTGSGGAT